MQKLLINNNLIPTIKIGEALQYLGRYFDFNMSNNNHETELTTLVKLMTDIDSKPLHPRLVPSRFYKSGRAARSGRVEAHGKGERRKFSDWQITVIFLARKCFSCKLIFYASNLDFLTLVYINR